MTMHYPLLVSNILNRARTTFPNKEIVTRIEAGGTHRYTYRDMAARVNRLCNALSALGVQKGDRVGTFGWNTYRHLEA
jgi:fatty-acyl-CoA synthase